VGVLPQGGHEEVGIDDNDIPTTAIPANVHGNANSVDGSAVYANVPDTDTATTINGDSAEADDSGIANSVDGSLVKANATATGMQCYCCSDTKLAKFNQENGFVKTEPAVFCASFVAFPGYLNFDHVPTNNLKERSLFIANVKEHSDFVYEVVGYFSFISDTTKNILCRQDTEDSFRLAFAERFVIFMVLVKRYTSSI
jgi:hypothetical protein